MQQSLGRSGYPENSSIYSHGVASGDPTHNSVLLWIRVSAADTNTVNWELALDSDLSRIIQSGSRETSHAFWANQLFNHSGQRIGVELGTAGIISLGEFEDYGPKGAAAFDRLVAEHYHEVTWTDCTRIGFLKLVLTADSEKADYIVVEHVKTPQYGLMFCAV